MAERRAAAGSDAAAGDTSPAGPAALTDSWRGVLAATLGIVVLSPDGLILRLISIDSFTVVFWRGIFSAVALGAFYLVRFRSGAAHRLRAVGWRGVLSAALLAITSLTFVLSISLTAVANTLAIISAAPLFGAVMSYLFLRERLAVRTWVASVVVIGGILIIMRGSLGGGTLLGDLLAVSAALTMAANLVVIRKARSIDMVPAVMIGGIFGAIAVLPVAAPLAPSSADFALLVLVGAVILPISLGLLTVAPRYIPAPEVSLIMMLEAVLGPLWVWLALSEVPPPGTFIGGAVVLVTLIAHSIPRRRRHSGP